MSTIKWHVRAPASCPYICTELLFKTVCQLSVAVTDAEQPTIDQDQHSTVNEASFKASSPRDSDITFETAVITSCTQGVPSAAEFAELRYCMIGSYVSSDLDRAGWRACAEAHLLLSVAAVEVGCQHNGQQQSGDALLPHVRLSIRYSTNS
jgi:hypothetical protein